LRKQENQYCPEEVLADFCREEINPEDPVSIVYTAGLTGRKKRMIITSGFNVYPCEVETVLNLHPAVQDSRLSGKEDLMRGELVKAQIVLKNGCNPDEKEIIQHCKVNPSPYKVPREFVFVPEIFIK
jgi:acyl-CoA synthetase (AMP-forming)/AMP-acid ligase II